MNAAAALPPSSPAKSGPGYGPDRSWRASLRLGFRADARRTVLERMEFFGPLRVQRPFHPEGGPCHCYLLHPPGGLVSGDRLRIEAQVGPGAHALLTTPAAGKVYGADSHNVGQEQDVRLAADGGVLEWLPMETIVFDRANATLRTSVELEGEARCLGWDILCLGRPAGGHPFTQGQVTQSLHISRAGVPLLEERLRLAGGGPVLSGAFGLAGQPVFGTLWAVGLDDAAAGPLLAGIRTDLGGAGDPRAGLMAATYRLGVLLVRYLGPSTEECRERFQRAWALLRPECAGRAACPPRIWST